MSEPRPYRLKRRGSGLEGSSWPTQPLQRLRALADLMEYENPDLNGPVGTWVEEIRLCCNEIAGAATDVIEKMGRI